MLTGVHLWFQRGPAVYSVRMKRTNLVLDRRLLDEARRLSGERTYSGAVSRALEDLVKRIKARRILELAGSGAWEGNLAEMRGDSGRRSSRRNSRRVPR